MPIEGSTMCFLFYWTSYIHQSGTQNLVLLFFKETFWHLFVCFKCQCTPAWRQECICTTTPLWALIKSNSSSRCEDSDIWICAIKHILLWRHVQLRCDNEFADVKVEWILSNGDCPNVAFGGFVTQFWPPVNIWFQMVETILWKGLTLTMNIWHPLLLSVIIFFCQGMITNSIYRNIQHCNYQGRSTNRVHILKT